MGFMSYRDDEREERKKKKHKRPQYMLWWKPDGITKLEHGPIYDKKAVKRDAFLLEADLGPGRAGWELFDDRSNVRRWR